MIEATILAETESFEDRNPNEVWSVQFEAFEGPVDLLLGLARDHKLDLAKISILKLAEEYLGYIERARSLRLEIAADYLVMAAWLAYLKSRFLLPKEEQQTDEPSPEMLADALAFQLKRLAAMQKIAGTLFARPLLGQQIFRRGQPEGLVKIVKPQWQDSLLDVLRAYGDIRQRKTATIYHPPTPYTLYSLDEAVERISQLFGVRGWQGKDWLSIEQFLPRSLQSIGQQTAKSSERLVSRSTMACFFGASLELAKSGKIELRQDQSFGPIYLRARQAAGNDNDNDNDNDNAQDLGAAS